VPSPAPERLLPQSFDPALNEGSTPGPLHEFASNPAPIAEPEPAPALPFEGVLNILDGRGLLHRRILLPDGSQAVETLRVHRQTVRQFGLQQGMRLVGMTMQLDNRDLLDPASMTILGMQEEREPLPLALPLSSLHTRCFPLRPVEGVFTLINGDGYLKTSDETIPLKLWLLQSRTWTEGERLRGNLIEFPRGPVLCAYGLERHPAILPSAQKAIRPEELPAPIAAATPASPGILALQDACQPATAPASDAGQSATAVGPQASPGQTALARGDAAMEALVPGRWPLMLRPETEYHRRFLKVKTALDEALLTAQCRNRGRNEKLNLMTLREAVVVLQEQKWPQLRKATRESYDSMLRIWVSLMGDWPLQRSHPTNFRR